jgi:hypothetical protein
MNDIFPMSERSGVNLRGEYGPSWEGPPDPQEGKAIVLAEAAREEARKAGVKDEAGDVKMGEGDVEELTPEQRKARMFRNLSSCLASDATRPQCSTRHSGSCSIRSPNHHPFLNLKCSEHFNLP